jgi:hypothetical protein
MTDKVSNNGRHLDRLDISVVQTMRRVGATFSCLTSQLHLRARIRKQLRFTGMLPQSELKVQ